GQALPQLGPQPVLQRGWAAHHIADLVTAAAQARHERLVDGLHAALQVALENTVELEVLARRDANRAVAPAVGDIVVRDVAVRADLAAGDAGSDHQLVVAVEAALARLLALVAVVLLVDPVELEDMDVGLVEHGGVLSKVVCDRAAQGAAGLFDQLY